MKLTSLLVLLIGMAQLAAAQTVSLPDNDTQLWNDVQLSTPIKDNGMLTFTGSARFGDNVSRIVQERVGASISFDVHRNLGIGTSFNYVASQSQPGRTYHEKRFAGDSTFQFGLLGGNVSNRHAMDFRFRQGFSTRYRTRLQYDHPVNVKGTAFGLFVWDELTYDGAIDAWSRMRIGVGGSRGIGQNRSIDIYYARQVGIHPTVNHQNILSTSLKFRLR